MSKLVKPWREPTPSEVFGVRTPWEDQDPDTMFGSRDDDGFDAHCPHCGTGYYFEVGPPGSSCPRGCEREAERRAYDERVRRGDPGTRPVTDEEVREAFGGGARGRARWTHASRAEGGRWSFEDEPPAPPPEGKERILRAHFERWLKQGKEDLEARRLNTPQAQFASELLRALRQAGYG